MLDSRSLAVWLLLFSSTVGFSLRAFANPYEGLSAFAASNKGFPCNTYIELTNSLPKPAIATLYGTFGESSACIKKAINKIKDRPHLLEIHLSNEACRRNQRCKGGELLPRLSVAGYENGLLRESRRVVKAVKRRVKQVRHYIIAVSSPLTVVVVSLGLEDNLSDAAAAKLAGIIRSGLPDWVLIVRNHVGISGDSPTSTDLVEIHGPNPTFSGACGIKNLDGTSIYDVSDQGRGFVSDGRDKSCFATFLWLGRAQGISSIQFLAPLKRNFYLTSGDVGLLKDILK